MPKPKQKEAEAQTGATAGAVTETIQRIPLSYLHPFEGHPFMSVPVIKCKKTPRKKCRIVAEVKGKR